MNEKFNLSDKIESGNAFDYDGFISVTNVKEFIKRLKEELDNRIISNTANEICKEIIDKLAGERLK